MTRVCATDFPANLYYLAAGRVVPAARICLAHRITLLDSATRNRDWVARLPLDSVAGVANLSSDSE